MRFVALCIAAAIGCGDAHAEHHHETAAESCTEETVTEPVSPSQWGRSVTLPIPVGTQRSQIARVHLPRPCDLSVYLSGQYVQSGTSAQQSATWLTYRVTVGSGGVALFNGQLPAAAAGTVRHFVADSIEVNAEVRAQPTPAGNTVRVFGCVAIGRPSVVHEPGALLQTTAGPITSAMMWLEPVQNVGWVSLAGGNKLFRVPPWATKVQVQVSGVAANTVTVQELSSGGTVQVSRTADNYALFQPFDAQAWFIYVTGAAGDVLVTFEKFT